MLLFEEARVVTLLVLAALVLTVLAWAERFGVVRRGARWVRRQLES